VRVGIRQLKDGEVIVTDGGVPTVRIVPAAGLDLPQSVRDLAAKGLLEFRAPSGMSLASLWRCGAGPSQPSPTRKNNGGARFRRTSALVKLVIREHDHHGHCPRLKDRVRLMRYTPAAMLQFPYLKLHQFVYRRSGGLVGSRIVAGRALLLTTTGRRSGQPRTTALIYLKDGERFVVVASNGGSDHPPSWLLNLQANASVSIQIGLKKFSARASVASAEERERLWPLVNRHNMGLAPIVHPGARGRYDVYQRHTGRVIPLVLLERDSLP